MAGFTVTGLSDYTAKTTELLTAGVLYSEDLSRYSWMQGIQYKQYLNYLDANPVFQAGACALGASGSTVFTQEEIEVVTYGVRDQYCKQDLVKKALSIPGGTLDGDFGPMIENTLTVELINKMKQKVDADLWLGTSGMIDGWVANLGTASIALDTYAGVTVSQTNVDDVIDDFIDNITDEMWAKGELTLHCSVAIFNMYKRNRLNSIMFRDANTSFGLLEMYLFGWEGQIRIKAEPGLNGSNTMLLTWDKNLYIGTDQVAEIAEAKWFFDENTDYLKFKSSFKLGTQVAFKNQVITNLA